MDATCVFCRIVSGQIPARRVWEDDEALAFLDAGPLAEGHLLVIPKRHVSRLEAISEQEIAAVARHWPRLALAVMKATSADGCNLLLNDGKIAGQEVPHVHWHIIPRTAGDGLGYRWNASSYAPGRAEQVQRLIVAALALSHEAEEPAR